MHVHKQPPGNRFLLVALTGALGDAARHYTKLGELGSQTL
jgi:hypothetical protein